MTRVLIVDDDLDTADSFGMLLKLHGHEVHVCYSHDECLEAFETFKPEVVLLDLWMPENGGLAIARKLRGKVPMVLVTGVATGLGEDADLFAFRILKPPTITDLLKGIEAALSLAR